MALHRTLALCLLLAATGAHAADLEAQLDYEVAFAPWADPDPAITDPRAVLGFPAGERSAFPAQIHTLFQRWAEESPRAQLHTYAESYEGRPLIYMVVTSPDNMARLDEIRAGMARLADPRGLEEAEARRLTDELPGIAWMAYSIHGNETSGSDAAVALAHHLVSDRSQRTAELLDDLVVIIDPMMNPDGRHRFLTQNAEYRGTSPSIDEQSLLHTGYWPGGRTNHYLFDLNRDWILGVHPETRGRIREADRWNPVYFLDAHEMGAQDTFLFSPARAPLNPYFPDRASAWVSRFAAEQGEFLDRYEWPYYTGEWNEGWYPGYSNAWAGLKGAIGFLFEQARIAEDGVLRPEGTVLSYRESVHHQFVSSIANLESLQRHRSEVLNDFLADRRETMRELGDRVFVVAASENTARMETFLDRMLLQGFEVYRSTADRDLSSALDQFGERRRVQVPAGSLFIPASQPDAALIRAMLDFDPEISDAALEVERRDIVAGRGSGIYDTTAWNITMMFGLEAYTLTGDLPSGLSRVEVVPGSGFQGFDEDAIAWVMDGADDTSLAMAGQLMERGVHLRYAEKDFTLDGQSFPRGSLVLRADDHRADLDDVLAALREVAAAEGAPVSSVSAGLGAGDLPDLGGGHFVLLQAPRVALLSRGDVSSYDFGAIWHHIDQRIGIRNTHLDEGSLNYYDLRRYNVLVVPERWGPPLSDPALSAIDGWVQDGGTLIMVGTSAGYGTGEDDGLGNVRQLSDVLGDLTDYDVSLQREWLAADVSDAVRSAWSRRAAAQDGPYQLDGHATPELLARKDGWAAEFMPQGALLAARVDDRHWLTAGIGSRVPVLFGDRPLLMTRSEAPVRFGVPVSGDADEAHRVGWGTLPAETDLLMRMSGLLWPEAAERIANAAWLTRDRVGHGQVIRFAATPVFRGSTLGTARMLSNALVLGPGLGASHPIRP